MPKITCMYAYVSIGENPEDEGVIAALEPNTRTWLPLVGADNERMESLRPLAAETAKLSGKKVKLVRFSVRSDLEDVS